MLQGVNQAYHCTLNPKIQDTSISSLSKIFTSNVTYSTCECACNQRACMQRSIRELKNLLALPQELLCNFGHRHLQSNGSFLATISELFSALLLIIAIAAIINCNNNIHPMPNTYQLCLVPPACYPSSQPLRAGMAHLCAYLHALTHKGIEIGEENISTGFSEMHALHPTSLGEQHNLFPVYTLHDS